MEVGVEVEVLFEDCFNTSEIRGKHRECDRTCGDFDEGRRAVGSGVCEGGGGLFFLDHDVIRKKYFFNAIELCGNNILRYCYIGLTMN